MSDRDLDQYLEGLGIDVDEDEAPQPLPGLDVDDGDAGTDDEAPDGDAAHDDESAYDGDGPDDDAPYGDAAGVGGPSDSADDAFDDIDMEAALEGVGAYALGVVPDDLGPLERTEAFLVTLLLQLDATYTVEVSDRGDEIQAEVFGGDYGRIIGKGGRTLAALEFLTNAVVNRSAENGVRVVIDVGGYKRRRDDRLRQTAEKAAARVRKSGEPVELEPMTAAERRVVHMAIADDPHVVSESTGEGRARRVVLKPAD